MVMGLERTRIRGVGRLGHCRSALVEDRQEVETHPVMRDRVSIAIVADVR